MKRIAFLFLVAFAARAQTAAAAADWVAMVATNAAAASEADFRDGALMPLLREEALAPLLAGPDRDAPWLAEAANYVERELLLAWEGPGWLTSPGNPSWGRAYDFTVREGSKDPFLTWMSVVGQKKWHWDDKARVQLSELEAALAARPADEAPFARLLAAHARQFVDPSPRHRVALCAAAVRWAESHAARPDRSEAVLRVLEQFVDVDEPAFVAALLDSAADPWIGLVAAGNVAFERHRDTCDPAERERNVADAEAAWRRARELHPEFPQGAEGMMRVAAHRKDRAGIAAWFRAGVAARFDSPSLHDRYAAFLRPACGGSIEALRRHARDCFEASDPGCFPDAAACGRARSMLPYGGVLALLAALDASGEKPAAFFGPGDAAEISAALLPMLGGDPVIGHSGATDHVRFESAWFLASVHWVLGDEEDALRAYETVHNLPSWYCRRMQESFPDAYDISIALSALAGPDADLVRALRRSFREGDFDGVVARCEEALAPRPDLDRSEMIFLEKLSVRAFLAAGFPRGETRRVPITPHGAFSGWYDYGNGWQPEVDDAGGYVWYTGRDPCGDLEFGSPLPLPLEIETAFEPSATNVLFGVRVFPSDLLFGNHVGPAPALSVRLEGDTLRVRLGPAGNRYLDWGVDKKTPVFETNVLLSAISHAEFAESESHAEFAESAESGDGARSPSAPEDSRHSSLVTRHSAQRIPLRIVFLPDRVRCYLGDAAAPALDAPTAAFAPAAFPDGAKLVFYGTDCRFFGFSFRNPAAENLEPGTFEPGTFEQQPNATEDSDMKLSSLAPAAAAAVLAAAPAAAPAQETADPATPAVAAAQETEPTTGADSDSRGSSLVVLHFEDADYVLSGPDDPREFLREWQEALLPLSSAVTQEVGAVAIVPDSADSAAWFVALWPDRAPDPFPALLLDDLGDAVLTNLDAAAAAAVEADPDYDSAWLLDETLPGIPEEHRRALMPFYDPMLVTLSFESYPDASRFAELAESESARHSSPVTRHSSLSPHPATNTAAGGFERAHGALGTAANGGLRTPPQAASNEKSGEEEAEVPPPPPPMPDFKLLQRLLYQELVVPYYAGPDGSTHLSCRGAREVWKFALELGRGQLALVPNREWGGAFDFVVRFGGDDPFVRFCASFGCWKWGWSDKARELRDDLAFRLAGGDATPFQSLLLAHLGQRYEPSPENLAALRDAFAAWGATLSGEFDRDDVRAWLGHWLVEDVADGGAPVLAKDTGPSPRASAIARRAADPAPDASPAPGAVPVYEDFVQATFHPLLLREIVAPLETIERDRSAPWRPMALAALRDWCLWTARGEDRLDPLYAGRAVSAAGRGCPWPAVRFLAALKDYDDTAFNPDTVVYGRDDPAATAAAARRVVEALAVADSDPGTTPLARHAMHRAFAECRHRRGESGFGEAGSYIDLLASRAWSGPEARAVWILRPHVVDWDEAAQAASDPWLREMASGYARLTGLFAPDADEVRKTIRGCFERAAALQPASPDPWIALLEFVAATPAEARAFYDEARARELDAPGADDAMIGALVREAASCGDSLAESPSFSALLAFGDDCLATGRFDTKLPYAWAKTRFAAASLLGPGWEAPFRGAAAITNMNRVCDARLADPLLGNDDRADAYYARVWPLYANNDFAALLPACEALGAAEGKRHGFTADFAPGHPMRRRALGVAYGLAGYHHDDIVAALRHWRVEGDLPAARDAFRARAGRVSAVTNTVDNWEQSYISGRLAVLECALARPGDPPYSLLPRAGAPGPRKFWRSREETVRFFFWNKIDPEAGVWWTADGSAGQMAASEPVVPSNAVLSFVVGHYAPDPAPARFWVVPDCSADPSPPSFGSAGGSVPDHFETSPSADPQGTDSSLVTRHPSLVHGLLVEWTAPGRCTLGWAWFDLYSTNAAPVRADGPRVPVRSPHDGRIRFDLELRGGDVAVSAGGVPLPDLSRRGLVSPDSPHPVSFAGRLFVLFRAAVRATPSPAEEPHAKSAESEPHAESAEPRPGEAGPLPEGAAERSEAGGVSHAESAAFAGD